jgi:RNA recognition motif-containing protein
MPKVYVGNIPFTATEEEIRNLFSQQGNVQSVSIVKDRETGRSRGFCFVEMDDITKAIAELNGKDFNGRNIVVNEARERERRPYGSDPSYQGGGDRGNRRPQQFNDRNDRT